MQVIAAPLIAKITVYLKYFFNKINIIQEY